MSDDARILLLVGDEFLVRERARQLADARVPESMQSLNLVVLDGPGTDARQIAQHLAQVPMFRGAKVVLVHDTTLLAGQKDLADLLEKARKQVEDGKLGPATRRVLGVLASAGWSIADLTEANKARFKKELGVDRDVFGKPFFQRIREHAEEQEWRVPESETEALERLIADPPGENGLILTAEAADKKHPLYRKIEEVGAVEVHRAQQRGRDIETLDISAVRDGILKEHGKRLTPGAERLLKRAIGSELRLLATELEKLCLFAGERPQVTEEDIRELGISQVREEAFWELGSAVTAGDAARALYFLGDALDHRHAPLQILGGIASAVRNALQVRALGERAGLSGRLREMPPELVAEVGALRGRKPHPFALLKEWERASSWPDLAALQLALEACARTDLELKGDGGSPRLALEALVFRIAGLARPPRRRAAPAARR
ncbi:MAG: hypothetical protein P1V51_20935 [Deltaproteobacteria bacterium]|nr:hypothetical protein [Deltaproteobacteria bacterium]